MTPMVKRRPFKPPKESTIAYIGLGANLGEREATIAEALRRIDDDDRTSLVRSSIPIETDPVGYEDQPRFLNAAASLATTRSPRELLDLLLEIERDLGRLRGHGPRYGPRAIDLDLLLYGNETIDEDALFREVGAAREALEDGFRADVAGAAVLETPLREMYRRIAAEPFDGVSPSAAFG